MEEVSVFKSWPLPKMKVNDSLQLSKFCIRIQCIAIGLPTITHMNGSQMRMAQVLTNGFETYWPRDPKHGVRIASNTCIFRGSWRNNCESIERSVVPKCPAPAKNSKATFGLDKSRCVAVLACDDRVHLCSRDHTSLFGTFRVRGMTTEPSMQCRSCSWEILSHYGHAGSGWPVRAKPSDTSAWLIQHFYPILCSTRRPRAEVVLRLALRVSQSYCNRKR